MSDTSPITLTKIGNFPIPREPTSGAQDSVSSLCTRGSRLYIGTAANGLLIVDVSNPRVPTLAGRYQTAHPIAVIDVVGTIAYVGDRARGVDIIDVSDPRQPRFLGVYPITVGNITWLQATRSLLYLTSGGKGFQIVDIQAPGNPVLLGNFVDLEKNYYEFKVVDGYAYCIGTDGADTPISLFGILDVRNPANIRSLGVLQGNSQTIFTSLSYEEEKIFISAGMKYGGTFVAGIDVSNPNIPQQVGSYPHPVQFNNITDVVASGSTAFIGVNTNNYTSSVYAIDVSNPPHYSLSARYNSVSNADLGSDLYLDGDLLYSIAGSSVNIIYINRPYKYFLPSIRF